MIYFLRINLIPKIITEIDEKFRLQQRYPTYFTMIKLFLMVFYSGHFFGCGFFFVAKYEIQSGVTDTWLDANNIADSKFSI